MCRAFCLFVWTMIPGAWILSAATVKSEEYNAAEHNLSQIIERIEGMNYYQGPDGFRVTAIEDCVFYDHQAHFNLGADGYEIRLKQIMINLRFVDSIKITDKETAGFSSSSTIVLSDAVLSGTSPTLVADFRIMGLHSSLWEGFLQNDFGDLAILYREATNDPSVEVVELTWSAERKVEWGISQFIGARPERAGEALNELYRACNEE